MREGEPSRTAFGAALHRAVHQDVDRGEIFRDPLAWQILGVDREATLAEPEASARPRLRLFIAVRHRFAEDSLAAAVERGTRQFVVLGAGLDTFAYRNPTPGPGSSRSTSRRPGPGSATASRTPASPYRTP